MGGPALSRVCPAHVVTLGPPGHAPLAEWQKHECCGRPLFPSRRLTCHWPKPLAWPSLVPTGWRRRACPQMPGVMEGGRKGNVGDNTAWPRPSLRLLIMAIRASSATCDTSTHLSLHLFFIMSPSLPRIAMTHRAGGQTHFYQLTVF